eukprot:496012_1
MSLYKNQEIQIAANFIGIADDGRVQVKIKGVDNVFFNVARKYVFTDSEIAAKAKVKTSSPIPIKESETYEKEMTIEKKEKKKEKKKKKTELDKQADDAWGASDDDADDEQQQQDDNKEEDNNNNIKVGLMSIENISIGDEKFHSKHKHKTIEVSVGGSVMSTTESKSVMAAFGSFECSEEGRIYHWKIQILEGNDVNLGVIFSDQCKKNRKQMWWLAEEGYSYWGQDGQIYHSDKYKKYGDTYGAGDIIDVWLNLKKYNISFAKNDEKYGKAFKVKKEQKYRFGVGLSGHPHKLQIIQFDIK